MPEIRYKEHLKAFGKPASDPQTNTIFHKALRKYGIENFSFSVIEECPNTLLDEREQYWIHVYNAKNNGYNMNDGGNSRTATYNQEEITQLWNLGLSSKEIQKIIGCCNNTVAAALDAQNIPLSNRRYRANQYKAKSVKQFTLEGTYLMTFSSIGEAVRYLGGVEGDSSAICSACTGKTSSAFGYLWQYTDDSTPISTLVKKLKTKTHHGHVKVAQYSLDGKYIQTFNTVKEAAMAVGAKSQTSITNACKGRSKTSFGYIWKYVYNT